MKQILKYLLFLMIGIIICILVNRKDNFSVGIMLGQKPQQELNRILNKILNRISSTQRIVQLDFQDAMKYYTRQGGSCQISALALFFNYSAVDDRLALRQDVRNDDNNDYRYIWDYEANHSNLDIKDPIMLYAVLQSLLNRTNSGPEGQHDNNQNIHRTLDPSILRVVYPSISDDNVVIPGSTYISVIYYQNIPRQPRVKNLIGGHAFCFIKLTQEQLNRFLDSCYDTPGVPFENQTNPIYQKDWESPDGDAINNWNRNWTSFVNNYATFLNPNPEEALTYAGKWHNILNRFNNLADVPAEALTVVRRNLIAQGVQQPSDLVLQNVLRSTANTYALRMKRLYTPNNSNQKFLIIMDDCNQIFYLLTEDDSPSTRFLLDDVNAGDPTAIANYNEFWKRKIFWFWTRIFRSGEYMTYTGTPRTNIRIATKPENIFPQIKNEYYTPDTRLLFYTSINIETGWSSFSLDNCARQPCNVTGMTGYINKPCNAQGGCNSFYNNIFNVNTEAPIEALSCINGSCKLPGYNNQPCRTDVDEFNEYMNWINIQENYEPSDQNIKKWNCDNNYRLVCNTPYTDGPIRGSLPDNNYPHNVCVETGYIGQSCTIPKDEQGEYIWEETPICNKDYFLDDYLFCDTGSGILRDVVVGGIGGVVSGAMSGTYFDPAGAVAGQMGSRFMRRTGDYKCHEDSWTNTAKWLTTCAVGMGNYD